MDPQTATKTCEREKGVAVFGHFFLQNHISLGDIRNLPTRSKFALCQSFLNFLSNAPKCRSMGAGGGGGMCILFEICEKRAFQKCMGWGEGVGGDIFER